MDLSAPLSTLVGTTSADALRVLSRTEAAMTGRQVARVAGATSPTGIKRALDKLERIGLVTVDRGLQRSSYRINRDHLLWPAVESALSSTRELERRIASMVDAAAIDVLSVSLFGSVARESATSDSDVDVAIVFDGRSNSDFAVDLGEHVRRWTGNECQVFDVGRADLLEMERQDDPLLTSFRRDARTVYGVDLRELI